MDFIRRWFTLPRRYNSLSDVARDPLGAALNAAQWVVPMAMGLPGGFSGLSNPSVWGKWSVKSIMPNIKSFVGSTDVKGLFSSRNLPLLVGGLGLVRAQREADLASRALRSQGDLYRELFLSNRPLYEGISRLQREALGVLSPELVRSQARVALERALRALEQSELQRGVQTLSGERRRSEALARYGQAVAQAPLEYARVIFGLPSGLSLYPLQLQAGLLNRQYADSQAQLASLAQALALMLPYIGGKR